MSILTEQSATGRPEPMQRRRRWPVLLVLGVVAVLTLGWIVSGVLADSMVYYRTPTEVLDSGGADVRVAGRLLADSVQTKDDGTTLFQVTDESTTLDVLYTGGATQALNSAAQPGAHLVAQGQMGTDGVFHAHTLMAKCPSKFSSGTSSASP